MADGSRGAKEVRGGEMKIIEALKNENIRISNGDKWLVWWHDKWTVCYRPYGAKKTRVILESEHEEDAVHYLLRQEP